MSLHVFKLQFENNKYRITPMLRNTVLMFFTTENTNTVPDNNYTANTRHCLHAIKKEMSSESMFSLSDALVE